MGLILSISYQTKITEFAIFILYFQVQLLNISEKKKSKLRKKSWQLKEVKLQQLSKKQKRK